MKIQPLIIGLIIGVLTGFVLTKFFITGSFKAPAANTNVSNAATNNSDTIKWKWADSLDAVKAAPQSHHLIFENDKIRILEVILQPLTQEPIHTHKWPSVMFGNNNGDTSHFDIVYDRYDFDSVNNRYFVKKVSNSIMAARLETIVTKDIT
jgi:hypothetical protein